MSKEHTLGKYVNLSDLTKLYTAYSYGGLTHAGASIVTSFADGALSSAYKTEKGYATLTTFWGYLAYKTISDLTKHNKIPEGYKAPVYALATLTVAGMVMFGPDVFGKSTSTQKTMESLKITASLFDETGVINELGQKFDQGFTTGITYGAKNIRAVLSNKFILYSTADQSLQLVKLALMYKFFNALPNGKMAALFAKDSNNPLKYLLLLSLKQAIKTTIDLLFGKVSAKLSSTLSKDIEKSVAKIALKEGNTQTVMKLGDKALGLSHKVSSISSVAKTGISSTLETIALPFITRSPSSDKSSVTVMIESYPGMVLSEMLINTIFSQRNLEMVTQKLKKYFEGNSPETDEDSEKASQKLGAFTINTVQNPSTYAFSNIQEIAKLGGNRFMLNKLLTYLDKEKSSSGIQIGGSFEEIFKFFKGSIQDMLYLMLFMHYNIDQQKLFSLESDLNTLTTALGISQNGQSFVDSTLDPKEIEETLYTLKLGIHYGPIRSLNTGPSLVIEGYKLEKSSGEPMLSIPRLEFKPGEIYAITGKIGTGKTTLLSDIAKCMMPAFNSGGTISYPRYGEEEVPLIFCGTVPFAPPGTTLFQKITYRLPSTYVDTHKSELEESILSLFTEFGQTFSKETLQVKGKGILEASTGQGKIIMILGAILYKQYLNKPVFLVFDETLANLDEDTTEKVCNKIKAVFGDSIVVSVDHNAKHNGQFYSHYIDLSKYKTIKEVEDPTTELDHKDSPLMPSVEEEQERDVIGGLVDISSEEV